MNRFKSIDEQLNQFKLNTYEMINLSTTVTCEVDFLNEVKKLREGNKLPIMNQSLVSNSSRNELCIKVFGDGNEENYVSIRLRKDTTDDLIKLLERAANRSISTLYADAVDWLATKNLEDFDTPIIHTEPENDDTAENIGEPSFSLEEAIKANESEKVVVEPEIDKEDEVIPE